MKTNARSQFTGIIKRIKSGDVGSEVTIMLPGGYELVAMITHESYNDLGLNVDSAVITLIKSTAIIVATDLEHVKLSVRSRLSGLICEMEHGTTNSVIMMGLGGGSRLAVGVTL